jgi:hypothetical protein
MIVNIIIIVADIIIKQIFSKTILANVYGKLDYYYYYYYYN